MTRRSRRQAATGAFAALVLALGLTACGGDDDKESAAGTTAAQTQTEAGGGDGAAAARESVAPYIGTPSEFPVTEPLDRTPTGSKIAFMDCGSPICAQIWEMLAPAGKTMGVELQRVKAGASASSVGAAFDTVVGSKPDAVIVSAINVELWSTQLKQLQDADVPVVTTGITGTEQYDVKAPQTAESASVLAGKLMADYTVANLEPKADVVIYQVPELPFAKIIADEVTATLGASCADCKVRTAQVPIAEIGTKAPDTIVSDLQANPDTNVAILTSADLANGLPSKLQVAGIDVKTLGYAPPPIVLEYIKDGKVTAGLGFDLPVLAWTLLDLAARQIVGQELTGPASEGLPVYQFLAQDDITFDPSKGWTGYPDFADRFAELWGVGK